MSYSYFISAAGSDCVSLRQFEPNIASSISPDSILSKLKKKYADFEWEDIEDGITFGSKKGGCSIEIWIFSRQPHRGMKVSGISEKEAVELGNELLLTVFDMQTGERLN